MTDEQRGVAAAAGQASTVRLDADLLSWLETVALPGQRVRQVERLSGGYQNENLRLDTDAGERYVLRRYLRANPCPVEAALVRRLAGVVPVAEVVCADPTGAVAGEPVLLSRFVPGAMVSALLRQLDAEALRSLGGDVGRVLASIGHVTLPGPGFFSGADLVPGPPGFEPTGDLPMFVERCLGAGNADVALSAAQRAALVDLAERSAYVLEAVRGARQLVHADFNPKNLLAERRGDAWAVTAVLDWEFAFSSTPLYDVGNMLRFEHEHPRPYAEAFLDGYRDAGGNLPGNWRELSQALDLFALADLLTRPPESRYFQRAAALLRTRLGATN